MAEMLCLWCEVTLKPSIRTCPECGLQRAADAPDDTPHHTPAGTPRRGKRFALVLGAMPLMLSGAFAAHSGNIRFPLIDTATVAKVSITDPLQPPVLYSDTLQRSVWVRGVKAVQQVLAQPSYADFSQSYINVAAGHVVTFCGEVAGTSGYDSSSGEQRFISVFGQRQSTTIEGSDASFDVLWTRVCAQDENPA